MTENPKLEVMVSDNLVSNCLAGEFGFRHSSTKYDSFEVDMERFAHLMEKDNNSANPRIMLQRNFSRKGSIERNISSNERDVSMFATSPTATCMPEKPKPAVGTAGGQLHHQITITNGTISSTAAAGSKSGGKRFNLRRLWTDPRRVLFFFATVSCMGTTMLIYLTLSMGKVGGEGSATS